MKPTSSIGLAEARRLTLENIAPLPAEILPLTEGIDRVAAADIFALVDSPTMDSSRKDGYAVAAPDIAAAAPEYPVELRIMGAMTAGGSNHIPIGPGETIRILTGARIPAGADAVVAEEFVQQRDDAVILSRPIDPGKNILRRGSDARSGDCLLNAGWPVSPVTAGLLASAGISEVEVFRLPMVGIIGTGDEIVEPGRPLPKGKLYASNNVTLAAWCKRYGMPSRLAVVPDDYGAIEAAIFRLAAVTDALITSGGAWTGEHDMVAQVLAGLGWRQLFHRIRIGPGKAVGLGMLKHKPVFILPGGPPSNLMGFLQIALPGLLALGGHANPGLPRLRARLATDLDEGDPNWTDFFYGTLEIGSDPPLFHPMKKRSRLRSISRATAVAAIPEGRDFLPAGTDIHVQLLSWSGMESYREEPSRP
ncbi:MAG: molybdopterin molybdotransferase MoeA [Deltaproteobacteria bacterium]|nr:molybdopterin molybdotransferase MoeA [Candidatus Anaeroferrophillacea bacterium]